MLVLVLKISPAEASFLVIWTSIAAIAGRFFCAWLSDVIGRRPTIVMTCLTAGVAMSLAGYLHSFFIGTASVFYLMLMVNNFFGSGNMSMVGPYQAEVWPSRLRASGMGLGYGFANLGKFIGPGRARDHRRLVQSDDAEGDARRARSRHELLCHLVPHRRVRGVVHRLRDEGPHVGGDRRRPCRIGAGEMSGGAPEFLAARDLLLRLRTDYDAAVREFRWPKLDRFNWALDHFDHLPGDRTALWLVGEAEERLSFGELQARSNQVANHLRALGVTRGDRVLLLLPNIRPLWEAMLALMKLGAVIIPATTLLTETDLEDRFERGRIRHAIVPASLTPRFAKLAGDYTRIAVGGAPGWHRFEDAYDRPRAFAPEGVTKADDPLLLYFTSGTTARPKMVLHSHQSYPVGHLSTIYMLGLQPGDVHLNISSPGWAKHAYSSFFAPWSVGATIVAMTQPRFDAVETLDLWCAAASPPSARRRRCGACWCSRTSRAGRCRCARRCRRASRSIPR